MQTTRVLVLAAVAAAILVAVGAQPAMAIQGGGEPSAADGFSYVGRPTVALADQAPPQSAPVIALGWGRGTGAAPLKAADMRVDRPASTPSWFDPASILVTVPDSRAANPGAAYHRDSGGPLVVPTRSGGYALAGIARSSIGARGGDVANAWVRTDGDSSTNTWIVEHAGGTPTPRGVGGAFELS